MRAAVVLALPLCLVFPGGVFLGGTPPGGEAVAIPAPPPSGAVEARQSTSRSGGQSGDIVAGIPSELAASWPEGGPRRLWERELGDGYSGVLFDAGRLYTMARRDELEVVVALDAASGKTLWEFRYESVPRDGHVHRFGDGPRSTPAIRGRYLYTVGVAARLHCLDAQTGTRVWTRDLWSEFDGTVLNHGYSSSPLLYDDILLVPVGGSTGLLALDPQNGDVRWRGPALENSYSTPRILDVAGERQVVAFMAAELVGADPATGAILWSWPHENRWRQNVHVPVMAGENNLLLSSPHTGSVGLRLERKGNRTIVEAAWSSKKLEFYHGSTVRDGDWLYGSSGTMTPAWLTAVNIKTGEVAWRESGFAKANLVGAGEYLIILDEDGWLGLATATPRGLTVHSRVRILESVAWTPPTLAGSTLFARDRRRIVALDLAAPRAATR